MCAKRSRIHGISTHAPARGATAIRARCADSEHISTHAPARGATISPLSTLSTYASFLLTPLREGRRITALRSTMKTNFYSRPCERGDRTAQARIRGADIFLLTPLREGRRTTPNTTGAIPSLFLLTPLREGRLNDAESEAPSEFISTHAPARGATPAAQLREAAGKISTHAPARGATVNEIHNHVVEILISTHAPARGATQDQPVRAGTAAISTHAPARGATRR